MSLEIKKQDKETTQSLIRRFTKAIKQSGVLREARNRRFFTRPLSKQARKTAALRKIRAREEYAKAEKLGLNKNKGLKNN
ncbi:MAG: 30S ribosomal protein S21 [Parcubacteria group bacterium ADurb.Bin247]|jgi:ribosomal protein S21|nr:MAG: 30S ribosomal protein S21 [Parcubacteria group bacterium ADurb.Bin247]HQB85057.1 30S ribosomal protein S21 [Candidatus Pacearchaeota archaeon]